MRHDYQDTRRASEKRINCCTPTRHSHPTRFPTGPRQIEIHKSLADRLAPMRQRLSGEHAFCKTRVDLDWEA